MVLVVLSFFELSFTYCELLKEMEQGGVLGKGIIVVDVIPNTFTCEFRDLRSGIDSEVMRSVHFDDVQTVFDAITYSTALGASRSEKRRL